MKTIIQNLEDYSNYRTTLRKENVSNSELMFISQTLNRNLSFTTLSLKEPIISISKENLEIRVEGFLRDLVQNVREFIAWLLERLRNIFCGKEYEKSNSANTFLRQEIKNAPTETKAFHSNELNKYYSFKTEDGAISSLKKTENCLIKIENFLSLFEKFNFSDYLTPNTTFELKNDLSEKFTKDVFSSSENIGSSLVQNEEGLTRGFEITEKLVIGLRVKTDNSYTLVSLPSLTSEQSKFIDIIYNYNKGFGFALNNVCDKTARLVGKIKTVVEIKTGQLKLVEKTLTSEQTILSKNVMVAGSIYNQWGLVLKELDLLVGCFNKALDQIEKVATKSDENVVKVTPT